MSAWLQQAALWTWQNSLAAAALAAAVLGMRRAFRGKIAARWLCLAGWLVMLRLLLPAPLPHGWAWDRAWAGPAPRVDAADTANPVEPESGAVDGAVTLTQLQEEVATARAALKELQASGFGSDHPKIIAFNTELSTREQALATMPAPQTKPAGWRIDWLAIALGIWIGGALCCGLTILVRHVRFMRRLMRAAKPVTLPWAGLAEECAVAAGLSRTPSLFVVPCGGSPFLCGLFRSRIVLPAETLAVLTLAEARHVLLHEMLHIARRDLFANWLLAAMRVWHWFNPLVHAVGRRLLADRELLRDAQAIALLRDPGQRSAYGHTLLKLALPLSAPVPSPGLAPLFHSEKELQRRLTMIQSPLRHRRLAACATAGALALISAPLFTTAAGQVKQVPDQPAVTLPAVNTVDEPLWPPQSSSVESPNVESSDNFRFIEISPAGAHPSGGALLILDEVDALGVEKRIEADDEPAEPPATKQPLENLRAIAAKLRGNGQTEEAEAIEQELRKLASGSSPSHDPSVPAPSAAGELQQLRAEMAEIRAALAGLQVKRVTELSQDMDQVEIEMDTLLNAGLGPKHPRILMLAGKMAAIQKQVESPKAPLAATGFYENMLEQDVAKLKTQLEMFANLKGEQLFAAFMELGLQNATIQKLYPEYQSELAALGSATKSGFGATHPKVKALRESTRTKFAQLEAAVENYRRSLKVQIGSSQKMLADARKRDADQVRRAKAVKGEDQAGDNLPWGVSVPGKKDLVYSPFLPEHSVVDVSGFKKGDKVKCPYTDNFFKVP